MNIRYPGSACTVGRGSEPVPARLLPGWFRDHGIEYRSVPDLKLAFGHGNPQYRLWSYPAPTEDETMGVYFEWHTEDYFDVDTEPHLAVGMRGPTRSHPHRGRGLAIGILANSMIDPETPDRPVALFRGCPDLPGGPSCFIEDFTNNNPGVPAEDWQLSVGKPLPQLRGNRVYRIDLEVGDERVWAGVWEIKKQQTRTGEMQHAYTYLGEVISPDPARSLKRTSCVIEAADRAVGNVFIGSGFADPETTSWIGQLHIAHWKNRF